MFEDESRWVTGIHNGTEDVESRVQGLLGLKESRYTMKVIERQ
jgi:hypothetical protein